jgi:hypothetical protein
LTDARPEYAEIIVTNIMQSMCGFAVRVDTNEQCYLPSSLVTTRGITTGDSFQARLVPNRREPERTPWFVSGCDLSPSGVTRGEAAQNLLDGDERAALVESIVAEGGTWRPEEVLQELTDRSIEMRQAQVSALLETLHAAGRIARATVKARPNDRPLATWYTMRPDLADFDEFEEDAA